MMSTARAQAGVDSSAPRQAPAVELFVAGQSQALEALRQALGPRPFRDAQATWFLLPRLRSEDVLSAPTGDVVARCFVDLSEPERAELYFTDRSAQRFVVRELNLSRGLDELGKETLAQIVQSSFEALLEEDSTSITREQVRSMLDSRTNFETKRESSPPAETATATTQRRLELTWAVFYGGEVFSRSVALATGPGTALELTLPGRSVRPVLWLDGQFVFPQTYQDQDIGVRLETIAWRAGAGLSIPLLGALNLVPRIGAGADIVRLIPVQGTAQAAQLTTARTLNLAVMQASTDLFYVLGEHTAVLLSAFIEADPSRRHEDLGTPTGRVEVLAPYRIRPGGLLAFAVQLR
jgi:hypothetical protein